VTAVLIVLSLINVRLKLEGKSVIWFCSAHGVSLAMVLNGANSLSVHGQSPISVMAMLMQLPWHFA
jgi:hypothetical protein